MTVFASIDQTALAKSVKIKMRMTDALLMNACHIFAMDLPLEALVL